VGALERAARAGCLGSKPRVAGVRRSARDGARGHGAAQSAKFVHTLFIQVSEHARPGSCDAATGAGTRSQQGRQELVRCGPRASVNATHEGTVMQPCSSGSTRGRPSSTTATTLLLVPRSMPTQHPSSVTNQTASAHIGAATERCMAHQCKLRRQCAAAAHAAPWTRGASAAPRSSGRPCRLRRARDAAPAAFPAFLTRSLQCALLGLRAVPPGRLAGGQQAVQLLQLCWRPWRWCLASLQTAVQAVASLK